MSRRINHAWDNRQKTARFQLLEQKLCFLEPNSHEENYVNYQMPERVREVEELEPGVRQRLTAKTATINEAVYFACDVFCERCALKCPKKQKVFRIKGRAGVFCQSSCLLIRNQKQPIRPNR